MVTDRQKDVLTCVVDTYIDTAEPMSSKKVLDRMRINVSSATIRQIFLTLDQNGYLEKLHTSMGRIPTDRGIAYLLIILLLSFGWYCNIRYGGSAIFGYAVSSIF